MYDVSLKVLKKITNCGFKAYIIGGYPRNLYLNLDSRDIDICTNATPKEIKEIFHNGVLPNKEYGGVTVVIDGIDFEITTFRKEIKYKDNRFPVKIKYIDKLEDDIKRRDFRINTLCIDENGNIIDLLNAKEDLDNKIIKTVGNSNDKIKTDILRSLRAIRFATILNFELDNNLKKSIKKYGYLLKKLSYYRKKEELDKIFSSSNIEYGIKLIKELDLEQYLELNLKDLIITTSSIGIWAQVGVIDKYPFTNNEKELINKVIAARNENILDNNVLYKYGLYICTLVGEIKQINRKKIVSKYNDLPIKTRKDIDINANEICNILNKKPGLFLKEIFDDLEIRILNNQLNNKKEEIIEYLK